MDTHYSNDMRGADEIKHEETGGFCAQAAYTSLLSEQSNKTMKLSYACV